MQSILGEKVAPTDILSVNKFHNTYVITFKGAVGNDLALKFNKATFSNTSGAITFAGTIKNSGCANPNVAELACVDLPIFVGTESSQVPIDFLGKTPGQKNHLTGHVSLDLGKLFSGDINGAFTYGFTPPDWGDFDFQTPSIFALLSDPLARVRIELGHSSRTRLAAGTTRSSATSRASASTSSSDSRRRSATTTWTWSTCRR